MTSRVLCKWVWEPFRLLRRFCRIREWLRKRNGFSRDRGRLARIFATPDSGGTPLSHDGALARRPFLTRLRRHPLLVSAIDLLADENSLWRDHVSRAEAGFLDA